MSVFVQFPRLSDALRSRSNARSPNKSLDISLGFLSVSFASMQFSVCAEGKVLGKVKAATDAAAL